MQTQTFFDGRCVISRAEIPENLIPSLQTLMSCKPHEPYKVTLHGRTFNSPRLTQAYGHDYRYSGQDHPCLPIPDWLATIIAWANETFGANYNSALVNWYMNGHHYIAPHSDDETPLAPNSSILTLSLGQTRTFRLRPKNKEDNCPLDLTPQHGTCIVMHPPTQKYCTHEIVKVSGKKGEETHMRISITLREFAS